MGDAGVDRAQARALEDRAASIERLQTSLALPPPDRAAVAACLDDFEQVFRSGTQAQKRHLLHFSVKEVRVYSRDSAEVWFTLPQPEPQAEGPVSYSQIWLRASLSVRNRSTDWWQPPAHALVSIWTTPPGRLSFLSLGSTRTPCFRTAADSYRMGSPATPN